VIRGVQVGQSGQFERRTLRQFECEVRGRRLDLIGAEQILAERFLSYERDVV
jgi:hypothetical protein